MVNQLEKSDSDSIIHCENGRQCLQEAKADLNGKDTTDKSAILSKLETKRSEYLSWEEYFMSVAFLAAQRSKDPHMQVGAVIVNSDKNIVGTGYNGMPNGCSDDVMPWGKLDKNPLNTKFPYVCHAEMNAILNKNCESAKNATIYTCLFPCAECAKLIIQSGIKEVVYMRVKPEKVSTIAAKRMFDLVGVKCRQFKSSKKIVIDLEDADWNNSKVFDLDVTRGYVMKNF